MGKILSTKYLNFYKMHSNGNDFVIFYHKNSDITISKEKIIELADRKLSIGFDQLLIANVLDENNISLKIFNQDGSESGACGNGSRCVAKIHFDQNQSKKLTIKTFSSTITAFIAEKNEDLITIDMGIPKTSWQDIPLAQDINPKKIVIDDKYLHNLLPEGIACNMGNPHVVFFFSTIEIIDIEKIGSLVECNLIFPRKTNVNFAQIINRKEIRLVTWERGVGITPSCGSGATATFYAAIVKNYIDNDATIFNPGGNLFLEYINNNIFLTGSAIYPFEGKINVQS